MKGVVLLFIIAVGIAGIGVGFAQNTIRLSLEDLGLGEDFIKSPVSSFTVNTEITRVCPSPAGCKTLITACLFKSADSIPGPARIICKLTDASNGPGVHGKVIAEGSLPLQNGYTSNIEVRIKIDQFAFPDSNKVKNIKDIKIVTLGPPVT